MTNFNQFSFDPRIQAGITEIGYTDPTPIQMKAIPVVLRGDDVLGTAQTGTGKTAAFMLPILERLTRGPLRRVRALVLAPTRELAEQIHQATVDFSKHMKVRSVAIYGGVSKKPQIDALRCGTEIVVACPGRLLDLMGRSLLRRGVSREHTSWVAEGLLEASLTALVNRRVASINGCVF